MSPSAAAVWVISGCLAYNHYASAHQQDGVDKLLPADAFQIGSKKALTAS